MNLKNSSNDHAFLSPSKYHWINYDAPKLANSFRNYLGIQKGVKLHEIASELIKNKIPLKKSQETLNMFVNDAIKFRMESEKLLYYSENLYGTTDAISFTNNFLRIHDLKTGKTAAHMEQLRIYAALYCMIRNLDPNAIKIELRIYQSNEIFIEEPPGELISEIIEKMIWADKLIAQIREEEDNTYVY